MRQKIPGTALYPGPTQIFTCMGGEPGDEAIPRIRHTILSNYSYIMFLMNTPQLSATVDYSNRW